MTDIVERLRHPKATQAEMEAAAEIKRLRDARRELLVATYTLASHFENALYAFRDDDEARKKAEGDIAFAMQIASRHNYNGDQQ